MAEDSLDISTEYPKPWTDEIARAADVIVTMGCGDACPVYPDKRYEDWVASDPGFGNWMSTDGHRFGAIGLRWNQAVEDVEPDVQVVTIQP